MSEEKVEIVRQWLRAFNERDLDALVALTTPDIEFVPYFASLIEATTYRGHDGLRRYFDDAAAVWDQIEGRVESVRVVGERAVVRGELRGKGKTSGLDVRVPLGWVADFEGKRIARIETFASEGEALEAAGFAE